MLSWVGIRQTCNINTELWKLETKSWSLLEMTGSRWTQLENLVNWKWHPLCWDFSIWKLQKGCNYFQFSIHPFQTKPFIFFIALYLFPLREFGRLPSTDVVNSYWFFTYTHFQGIVSNTTCASSMPRKTKEYLYIKTFILCTRSKIPERGQINHPRRNGWLRPMSNFFAS